jgi:hypothetical protein
MRFFGYEYDRGSELTMMVAILFQSGMPFSEAICLRQWAVLWLMVVTLDMNGEVNEKITINKYVSI